MATSVRRLKIIPHPYNKASDLNICTESVAWGDKVHENLGKE